MPLGLELRVWRPVASLTRMSPGLVWFGVSGRHDIARHKNLILEQELYVWEVVVDLFIGHGASDSFVRFLFVFDGGFFLVVEGVVMFRAVGAGDRK